MTTTRSCPETADTHPLDLTSATSVRAFAGWLEDDERAGSTYSSTTPGSTWTCAAAGSRPSSSTGTRSTGGPTTWGPRTSPGCCCPMLTETAGRHGEARVVNVVSKLHARGRNEWLFDGVTPYDSWAAYGTSKLALVHEAAEIERRYGAGRCARVLAPPWLRLHRDRRPGTGDRAGARPAAQAVRAPRAPSTAEPRAGSAHDRVLRDLRGCDPRWLPPQQTRGGAVAGRPGRRRAGRLWDQTSTWVERLG